MPEMDGPSKPPQISEMFQKFALAFRTKTFEFFADEDDSTTAAVAAEDFDGFSLLDSAEEIITDQKVVVIKPDSALDLYPYTPPSLTEPVVLKPVNQTQTKAAKTHLIHTLISSIFATVSSFEASYFQLQTAHVPLVEENVKAADRILISHLQRLSEFKKFYRNCCENPEFHLDFPFASCLEAQVEENQSKLRALGTVSNRLQSELEQKHDEVSALRRKLDEMLKTNVKLSKKLCVNVNSSSDVVLCTVRVFDSILHDASRATHKFTKILISLMRKAGWDLDLVANVVHPNIGYAKKGHSQYALLSYVCLGMLQNFESPEFGLRDDEIMPNGHVLDSEEKNSSLKLLLEHVSSNPMELLSIHPSCDFAKFCELKYERLVHPTMESSIFINLDQNEVVLNSWRSLSMFYEAFVTMASSIWTLHKLSYTFDPAVEIFQVERGVEFSMVYMEDVARRLTWPNKSKAKVGFTVVPGFKIGRTVIQSQVYLSNSKATG